MANLSDRINNLTFVPAPQSPDTVGATQEIPESADVPDGWLEADGSIKDVVDYPDLGALYGSTFGGDGVTTFGLPGGSYTNNLVNTGDLTVDTDTLFAQSSTGRVGVGQLSPAYKFDVEDTRDGNYVGRFRNLSTTNPHGLRVDLGAGPGTGKALTITTNNFSLDALTVQADGNVGIGTASPATPLEIVGAGTQNLRIQSNGGTIASGGIEFVGNDAVVDWAIGTNKIFGTGLEFISAGSMAMYIETGGNVGIGTTGPAETLDVNGTIRTRAANYTLVGNEVSSAELTAGVVNTSHLIIGGSQGSWDLNGIAAASDGTLLYILNNSDNTMQVFHEDATDEGTAANRIRTPNGATVTFPVYGLATFLYTTGKWFLIATTT